MILIPDQRSTSDQLEDVAKWAEEEGLGAAAAWVRAWDWEAERPSPEDYQRLCQLAIANWAYDARDALHHIYTKRWRP